MSLTMLEQIKFRIGDALAAGFEDTELQSVIDNVKAQFSLTESADPETILDITQAKICLAVATDTSRYFKYTQNTESVDKTKTPEELRKIAKDLLDWHASLVQGSTSLGVVDLAAPREFVIDRNADGDTED